MLIPTECTQLPSVSGKLYYYKRALRVVLWKSESTSVTSAGCRWHIRYVRPKRNGSTFYWELRSSSQVYCNTVSMALKDRRSLADHTAVMAAVRSPSVACWICYSWIKQKLHLSMLPQFHWQYIKPHDTHVYCIGWIAQNYIHEISWTSRKYTHHTHYNLLTTSSE